MPVCLRSEATGAGFWSTVQELHIEKSQALPLTLKLICRSAAESACSTGPREEPWPERGRLLDAAALQLRDSKSR